MIAGDQYFGDTMIRFFAPLAVAVIVAILLKSILLKIAYRFHICNFSQERALHARFPSRLEEMAPSLFLILLAVGVFLRITPYLFNRSFWGDEAWVAFILMSRSWQDILTNANLNSTQPLPQIGFALVEKGLIGLFGVKELVFRSFPWLCGVWGCLFFAQLSRKILSTRAALMATAFFVLSEKLIYYSVELKPYSSEVMFAVLVYSAYIDALRAGMDKKSVVRLIGWGAIALFFSLSNAIILLSVAIVWLRSLLKQGRREEAHRFLMGAGFWALLFLFLYSFYYRAQLLLYFQYERNYLRSMCLLWPLSKEGFLLFGQKVLNLFRDPVGLFPAGLTAAAFVWGGVSCWRKDRAVSAPFLWAVGLVIFLAAFGKIPLVGRMLLFLLPAFYLVIAQGLSALMDGAFGKRFLGMGVFLVLLMHPFASAIQTCTPEEKVDIRSVTLFWQAHRLPGDRLYFNNESQWGIVFYSGGLFLDQPANGTPVILESLFYDNDGTYGGLVSLDQTVVNKVYAPDHVLLIDRKSRELVWTQWPRSGRTWVLLTQMPPETEKFFVQCLDRWGQRLQTVKREKAALYLYDLSGH